jgi:hypothetical protein
MNYPLSPTIPTRFEDEYPEAAAHLVSFYPDTSQAILPRSRWLPKVRLPGLGIQQPAVYERNARCECGSGLKQKKCCMMLKPAVTPGWWSMRITRLGEDPVNLYMDSMMIRHMPRPRPVGQFLTREPTDALVRKPVYTKERPVNMAALMYATVSLGYY